MYMYFFYLCIKDCKKSENVVVNVTKISQKMKKHILVEKMINKVRLIKNIRIFQKINFEAINLP